MGKHLLITESERQAILQKHKHTSFKKHLDEEHFNLPDDGHGDETMDKDSEKDKVWQSVMNVLGPDAPSEKVSYAAHKLLSWWWNVAKPKNWYHSLDDLLRTFEQNSGIDENVEQPLNESIDGNNMIENEKFKNDFYFKKFSEHAHHFEKLADSLVDGVDGDSLEEKWFNYMNQMKNKDFSFGTDLGVNITNDIYGKVLDYPLAEGESLDNAVGIAIVTFLKMGRTKDDIKIMKLMNIVKKYIGGDDFKVFTTKKHTEEVPSSEMEPMNEAREILKKTFNKFIK